MQILFFTGKFLFFTGEFYFLQPNSIFYTTNSIFFLYQNLFFPKISVREILLFSSKFNYFPPNSIFCTKFYFLHNKFYFFPLSKSIFFKNMSTGNSIFFRQILFFPRNSNFLHQILFLYNVVRHYVIFSTRIILFLRKAVT